MKSDKCFHVSHFQIFVPMVFITVLLVPPHIREPLWYAWAQMEKEASLGGFRSGSQNYYLNKLHQFFKKVTEVESGQLCSYPSHIHLLIISRCFGDNIFSLSIINILLIRLKWNVRGLSSSLDFIKTSVMTVIIWQCLGFKALCYFVLQLLFKV